MSGIENSIADNLSVYPNPTTGIVTINAHEGQMKVLNIQGKVVAEITLNTSNSVNISSEPAELCILNVMIDGSVYYYKVVKK